MYLGGLPRSVKKLCICFKRVRFTFLIEFSFIFINHFATINYSIRKKTAFAVVFLYRCWGEEKESWNMRWKDWPGRKFGLNKGTRLSKRSWLPNGITSISVNCCRTCRPTLWLGKQLVSIIISSLSKVHNNNDNVVLSPRADFSQIPIDQFFFFANHLKEKF